MDHPYETDCQRRASRMDVMVDRLHVDRSVLIRRDGGAAVARAKDACMDCKEVARCLSWLDAASMEQVRPSFCRNLNLFETCKIESA